VYRNPPYPSYIYIYIKYYNIYQQIVCPVWIYINLSKIFFPHISFVSLLCEAWIAFWLAVTFIFPGRKCGEPTF
jgi:hypothetical protein